MGWRVLWLKRGKRAENKSPAEKDKFPPLSDLDHFRRRVERDKCDGVTVSLLALHCCSVTSIISTITIYY